MDTSGMLILAGLSWLGAMMMGGLMAAWYRISGLQSNGLLEKDSLGPVLRNYLENDRLFQSTLGTLYLVFTVLGCFAWGNLLASQWGGNLNIQFYLLFIAVVLIAWTLGGLAFKLLAINTAVTYARLTGTILFPVAWLLRPWSILMLAVMDRMDDTLWTGDLQSHLSAGEIRSLISDEGADNVVLDDDEREMIQSIFEFHDKAVREIMIPRIDMTALDGEGLVAEMLSSVIASGHSRIPIFEGGVDKITGILYSKDILKLVKEDRLGGDGLQLADLTREAYFIPESKKIDEVLDEFRSKRIHMAIVIDEYGGTAGLVTLEDVIEEIVGEIEDEFDSEETLLAWVDACNVRLDPKINLEDLGEMLGIDLTEAEGADSSETLGGLVYEAAGKVPEKGDRVQVAEYRITVEDILDQRIRRVLLHSETPMPGFKRGD
jgi:putative hemolysin